MNTSPTDHLNSPLQPSQPTPASKFPWGFVVIVIFMLIWAGRDKIGTLASLWTTKVEVREEVSPQKKAQDLAVWKEQNAVLNEQINAAFKNQFGSLPETAPVPPAERTINLDLVTKIATAKPAPLGFWDSLKYRLSDEGVLKALTPKVPSHFKVVGFTPLLTQKLGENEIAVMYMVMLSPIDTLQAVPVKSLTSFRPELARYSSIVNQIALQTDLPPGKTYRFDRTLTIAKAGTSVPVIWWIRHAQKRSEGWVITATDPILFNREYETQGDPSFRIRSSTELLAQSQQFQQSSLLLMAKIEEAQRRSSVAQSSKGQSNVGKSGPTGWDIGNAAMNAINLGLNIFNATKK